MLDNLNLTASLDFNVLFSCDDTKFKVQFNKDESAELAYNSTKLTMVTDVAIAGSLQINSAGYTGKVIMRLFKLDVDVLKGICCLRYVLSKMTAVNLILICKIVNLKS